jgi:hypothetical protein
MREEKERDWQWFSFTFWKGKRGGGGGGGYLVREKGKEVFRYGMSRDDNFV